MPADPGLTHVAKTLAHTSPFLSCRFDPTGRFVFAGAEDFKVVRWELATGRRSALTGHRSWIRALAFREGLRGEMRSNGAELRPNSGPNRLPESEAEPSLASETAGVTAINARDVPHSGFKVVGDKTPKLLVVHVVDKYQRLYDSPK